ncbi:MAG: TetR/AcrR family transcriptional regulator [Pseudomonadota bacterium]|nr:TetR/AcrR family transcriptional regulator [Pseudomonadota bacterium]
MKMSKRTTERKRPYRQGVRAQAAAQTPRRIIAAFVAGLQNSWFEEITLDEVAANSGLTVQTVIRQFGSKEGLLVAAAAALGEQIREARGNPVGDLRGAVRAVVHDYEVTGDMVMRLLAQERLPAIHTVLDIGRAGHRKWLGRVFAPWLERLPRAARGRRHAALVVLTDVYTWKLLRRDRKFGRDAVVTLIIDMISALNGPLGTASDAMTQ